jgi:hypothetical protein
MIDCPDESENRIHFPVREMDFMFVPHTAFEKAAGDSGSTVRGQFILTD